MIGRTLVACLGCLAALSAAGPAHAAFPGPNGGIAFAGIDMYCGTFCWPQEIMQTGPNGGFTYILAPGAHPAWSADGQRLAFADGTDVYTMKPDGSDRRLILDWSMDIEGIAWAPGGDRLAAALVVCDQDECRPDIHVIRLGPAGAEAVVNITPDLLPDRNPAWSPGGDRIAFDTTRDGNHDVFTMDADGTNLRRLTTDAASDSDPNWAPSGDALAFTSMRDGSEAIYTMSSDGTVQTRRTGVGGAVVSRQPAWSPDGTRIVFSGIRQGEPLHEPRLYAITADGQSEWQVTSTTYRVEFEPDWRPAAVGYPRPRAASPSRVSLVPSYAACTAPNRMHGPPLAFGACHPPSQQSPHLTVGTPDANGAAASSAGFASFKVVRAIWSPPDQDDVAIELSLSDIRCNAGTTACGAANDRAGPDYIGELRLEHMVRLTQETAPYDPTTVQDFAFGVRVGCSATSSTATGADCSVSTSANAVVPGSVSESLRTIWQMRQIRVLDGGADGDVATAGGNRVFATQGVFVP